MDEYEDCDPCGCLKKAAIVSLCAAGVLYIREQMIKAYAPRQVNITNEVSDKLMGIPDF